MSPPRMRFGALPPPRYRPLRRHLSNAALGAYPRMRVASAGREEKMALRPVIPTLQGQRVVLASASPRRQEILSNAGLRFEVIPSRFKETLDKSSFPEPPAYAVETARHKALEVARRLHEKDQRTPDLVIAADTIVAIDGLILEKPADKEDAFRMLSRLSGKEHSVFTGVALLRCRNEGGELRTRGAEFFEETRVTFSELSPELLWDYVHSGEPMDKAGGYGIQALGGMLVERVSGDFLNVVGFPLNRFCKELPRLLPPRRHGDRDDPGTGAPPPPPPVPEGLLRLVDGCKASWALFSACRMQVFDVLGDGDPPRTAAQVAAELGAPEAGTRRLLDACAALGLLHRTAAGFSATPLSHTFLTSRGPFSLRDLVLHAHACARGTDARTPRTTDGRRGQVGGGGGEAEPLPVTTAAAMHGLRKLEAPGVAAAFDLSSFASTCHLGGCACGLAAELAWRYPSMAVTAFHRPDEYRQTPCAGNNGGPADTGVAVVHGDIHVDRLPAAELYVLWGVPDDWPDDRVRGLLSKMADGHARGVLLAGAPCGASCVNRPPPHGLRRALDALADAGLTDGRRERDGDGVRALLREAGFGDVRTGEVDGGHVMLATRAGASPRQPDAAPWEPSSPVTTR